jgi:cysteine-rich repeat protein
MKNYIFVFFLAATWTVVAGSGCVSLNSVLQSPEACDAGDPAHYGINFYGNITERILVATLYNHTSDITNVHFSNDGKYLVSCGFESSINLWEVATGKIIHKFAISAVGGYDSARISPDSRTVASVGYDGVIRLWDIFTGNLIGTIGNHAQLITAIRFSPDGSLLASGSQDNTIKLWDVANKSLIATFTRQTRDVNDVDFNHDGTLLAMASSDFSIKLWDVHNRSFVANLSEHQAIARAVDFSPDGKLLASGGDDAHIILWDVENRTMIARWKAHNKTIESIKFSTNGTILVSGSRDNLAKVWDVKKRSLITPLTGHTSYVNMVDFNPVNDYLATGSSDKKIKIWDLSGPFHKKLIDGHKDAINALAVAPTTPRMASGDDSGIIKIFDVRTKSVLHTLSHHAVKITGLAFSKGASSYLVSADVTGRIHVWDAANNFARITQNDMLLENNRHTDSITAVTVSKGNEATNNIFIATSSWDGTVNLWYISPTKNLTLTPNFVAAVPKGITCVLFSPSTTGNFLAVGDGNGQVRVFTYSTAGLAGPGTTINSQNPWYIQTLSYSGTGRYLLVGDAQSKVVQYDMSINPIDEIVVRAADVNYMGILHAEIIPIDRQIRGTSPFAHEVYVVYGSSPRTVFVYRAVANSPFMQIFPDYVSPIRALKISQYDGSIMVAGEDMSITRWTMERGCDQTCMPMQGFQCSFPYGQISKCCRPCPVGFTCDGNDVCVSSCGNGVVDPGEQCDDGFVTDGDGCSSKCLVESPYICTNTPGQASVCGIKIIITAQGTCPTDYNDLVNLGKKIVARNIPSQDASSVRILDITCTVVGTLLRMRMLEAGNIKLDIDVNTDEPVNQASSFTVPQDPHFITGQATVIIQGIICLFIRIHILFCCRTLRVHHHHHHFFKPYYNYTLLIFFALSKNCLLKNFCPDIISTCDIFFVC